jgi:hypothetical protein
MEKFWFSFRFRIQTIFSTVFLKISQFYGGSGSISGSGIGTVPCILVWVPIPLRQKITVPAVQVLDPASQHWFWQPSLYFFVVFTMVCTRIERLLTHFLQLRGENHSKSFCLVMMFTLLLHLLKLMLLLTNSRCAGVQASSEMALRLHCDSVLSPSTRSQQGSSQQHRRSLPGTWAGLAATIPPSRYMGWPRSHYSRF